MKAKTLSYALAAVITLGLAPSPAFARGGHGGRGGEGHHERLMEKLELTDAQKTKLKELRKTDKEKSKADREKMREARKKLREALATDASKGDLKKLHEEVQGYQRAMADRRFEKMLAIRDILTPEQRKKFGELKGEGRGRRGGGMGRHGRHHDDEDGPRLEEGDEE